MELTLSDEQEELEYLRYAVGHLMSGYKDGRTTSGGSASLDHGWDLLEEYVDWQDRTASLAGR